MLRFINPATENVIKRIRIEIPQIKALINFNFTFKIFNWSNVKGRSDIKGKGNSELGLINKESLDSFWTKETKKLGRRKISHLVLRTNVIKDV